MVTIAIEGVDYVGKSSIADFLARNHNFTAIKVPQKEFMPETKAYVKARRSTEVLQSFIFYSAANAYTSLYVSDYLKSNPNSNIVLDRFTNSNYISHIVADEIYNGGKNVKVIESLFERDRKNLFTPDMTVFLYADQEARKLRMLLRGSDKESSLNTAFDEQSQRKLMQFVRRLKESTAKVMEIDTSHSSVEETGSKIVKAIGISLYAQ